MISVSLNYKKQVMAWDTKILKVNLHSVVSTCKMVFHIVYIVIDEVFHVEGPVHVCLVDMSI